jgi:hypothetical protein
MEPQQDVCASFHSGIGHPEPIGKNEPRMRGGVRVCIRGARNVNRQSEPYLADFLQGDMRYITAMELCEFTLSYPPDGGFHVFANESWATPTNEANMSCGLILIDSFQSRAVER